MKSVLKITRNNLTFIVPFYWMDIWGFLKPEAVCTLKVFFGVLTNEQADKELEKRAKFKRRGFYNHYYEKEEVI